MRKLFVTQLPTSQLQKFQQILTDLLPAPLLTVTLA